MATPEVNLCHDYIYCALKLPLRSRSETCKYIIQSLRANVFNFDVDQPVLEAPGTAASEDWVQLADIFPSRVYCYYTRGDMKCQNLFASGKSAVNTIRATNLLLEAVKYRSPAWIATEAMLMSGALKTSFFVADVVSTLQTVPDPPSVTYTACSTIVNRTHT